MLRFRLTRLMFSLFPAIAACFVPASVLGAVLIITPGSIPVGTVGQANYKASYTVGFGNGNYTWSVIVTGSDTGLPPGTVGLQGADSSTFSVFAAAPMKLSQAGTFTFHLSVVDTGGNATLSPFQYSISVVSAPSVITTSLPAGEIGLNYQETVQAAGGLTPLLWSLSSGSLPAGLVLDPGSGHILGQPTTPGNSSFVVQVTDANGVSATQSLSITVAAVPVVSTTSLPGADVGQQYSQQLAVSGGTSPFTWTVVSGSLPAGLTLTSSGALQGQLSTAGTLNFTAQVQDANGARAARALSIVVSPAPAITTSSLPGADLGQLYSQQLAASGGVPPFTWTFVSGTLPDGLLLVVASGVIQGQPIAPGTSSFKVQAEDSNHFFSQPQSFSITVAPALRMATAPPPGQAGTAYSATLSATGGTPPYTWTLIGGSLPAGLVLTSAGAISGTPTSAGSPSFTVKLSDSVGGFVTANLSITISTAAPPLTISTTGLPPGQVGTSYLASLSATGGTAPYTWVVTGGSLPAGLALNSAGAIAGTPISAGSSSFTVKLADSAGGSVTANLSITISAATPPPLVISTTTLPPGQVGTSYSASLSATGGTPPYTWALAGGSLPAGLSLNSSGAITGTPTSAGASNFSVKVVDSTGTPATANLSITVTAAPLPTLTITSTSLPNGQQNSSYSVALSATGGKPPYTWSKASGSLPAGLALTSAGVISGTPTAAGQSSFTVQVADSAGNTAQASFQLTIQLPGLGVSTSALANGEVGVAYSSTLAAGGGTAPYTWTLASGTLPAGLALSSTGVISGTPAAAGTFDFTVGVNDSAGNHAQGGLTLTIEASGLAIGTTTLPNGDAGVLYSAVLSATGGTPPYAWSITEGTLPAGLTLNASGLIAGTPTAATASTFTVQVTDSASGKATAVLTLTIGAMTPQINSVVNAASYSNAGVAPGELVTIFGINFGPPQIASLQLTNGNRFVTTEIAGTQVLFDGTAAPIIYSLEGQISAIAPFEIQGTTQVQVVYQGQTSAAVAVPVLASQPGLFSVNQSGTGPGAILNQDLSPNSEANPAAQGSIIILFATGGGQMNPAGVDGEIAATTSTMLLPVTAAVNNQTAPVVYSGNAPTLLEGVMQVNVQLPSGIPSGAVPVVIQVGSQASQTGVTVWVK